MRITEMFQDSQLSFLMSSGQTNVTTVITNAVKLGVFFDHRISE